jgi:hypothetical protein
MKHMPAMAWPVLVACLAAPSPGVAQLQYAAPTYKDSGAGYQPVQPRGAPPAVIAATPDTTPGATAPDDGPFKLQSQFDMSFRGLKQRLDPPQPAKPP